MDLSSRKTDFASLPRLTLNLDERVHYTEHGMFVLFASGRQLILGDLKVMQMILESWFQATSKLSSFMRAYPPSLEQAGVFVIVHEPCIYLWLQEGDSGDCLVQVKREWVDRMHPVFVKSVEEALAHPGKEHIFRAGLRDGTVKPVRTATQCGSD